MKKDIKKKMNILFDCRVILDGFSKNGYGRAGIYFVAFHLLRCLMKRDDCIVKMYCGEFDYKFFTEHIDWAPEPVWADKIVSYLAKKYKGLTKKYNENNCQDKQILAWLNNLLRTILKVLFRSFARVPTNFKYQNIDVFISPINKIPRNIAKNPKIRKSLWIHDLIPALFNLKEHQWFFEMFDSLNNLDVYFAVSNNTKKDLLDYKHHFIDKNKVFVIPLAASENFSPQYERRNDLLKKYGLSEDCKYIFSLCTLTERKNLLRTVRTFIHFIDKHNIKDMYFLLGGGTVRDNREKILKEVGNRPEIKLIGYVADEDLPVLYSGSEWFIYTSQYEGWGLPPLEAMACGCPVITSNNSSLPEVVGDAGLMIDWDDDQQHIAAYEKYYFNDKFRANMREKGLLRSKQFSWDLSVDLMLKHLQDVNKKERRLESTGNQPRVTKNSYNLSAITEMLVGMAIKKVTSFNGKRNLVLLMDNLAEPDGNLQDNFTFFKFLYEKQDKDLVPYYVINKSSPNFLQLKTQYGEHLLEYRKGGLTFTSQIKLLKIAKHLRFVCDSFQAVDLLKLNFTKSVRRSSKITSIFTQHGITFFKPDFITINTYGANIFDKVVCSNEMERELFLKRGRYCSDDIISNGLFRWDNIKTIKKEKPTILFFFTSRRYLAQIKEPGDTVYCRKIIELLKNPKLTHLLKEHDVQVSVALHHSVAEHIRSQFAHSNIRCISEDDIFEAKCSADLLITDYSSMCFEFMFQNKPVIFYHFNDSVDCIGGGHVVDITNPFFGKEELLFNLFEKESEVITCVEKYINNNFVIEEENLRKAIKFYYYRSDFCDRFYKYLKETVLKE